MITFLVNPIYDLDEAIKAGKFDWMYDFIKDPINRKVFELHNSRIPKMKESELELIHFGKEIRPTARSDLAVKIRIWRV